MPETPSYLTLPHSENIPGTLVRRKNDGSIDGAGGIDAQGANIPTDIAPYSAMAAVPYATLQFPGMGVTATAQNTLQDRLIAYPVYLPAGLRITSAGIFLTATNAVGTIMVGIYNNLSAANFFPGTLLKGSAIISAAAGANTYKMDAAFLQVIPATGWYWAAVHGGGANLHSVRALSSPGLGPLGFSSTGAINTSIENSVVFGATMPDPFTVAGAFMRTTNAPLVMVTLGNVVLA